MNVTRQILGMDAYVMEDLVMRYEELWENVDQIFVATMGIFVLLMHAGFAFLETGSVRSKNATNSIFRNVLDLFIGAIAYWSIGFAFAYGEPGNAFIGHNHFFSTNVKADNSTYRMVSRYTNDELYTALYEELENGTFRSNATDSFLSPTSYFAFWFFQYVFAISATTIASGAMAERVGVVAYLIYCFIMTGFIYPVVSHWCWSGNGWLKSGVGTGLSFQDFAGSAVVHITGGTAALVGAGLVGARSGRFHEDGTIEDFSGHSTTITSLGGYILFAGFMAFNGGSILSIKSPESGLIFATAICNTVIGGGAGALTAMLVARFTDYLKGEQTYWSLMWSINGGLAGMVSMCATCNDLNPWSAFLIGAIAGAILVDWHYFLLYIKIDDPLDAVGIHLGGGLCGIILGPIFAIQGLEVDGEPVGGVVFGGGKWAWKNWGWNLGGAAAIMAWTAFCTGLIFGVMRLLKILRVTKDTEVYGADKMLHNEPAYPLESNEDECPIIHADDSST